LRATPHVLTAELDIRAQDSVDIVYASRYVVTLT
jgi:hypothetical protein